MALQQNQTDPALWEDPAVWKDGKPTGPATYAVVIGVSRYDHLPARNGPPLDPEPPFNAYGLQQLHVSALTAHSFFGWLRSAYKYDTAPLARCWMLLSPTPEEVAEKPELGASPRATMAECQRVLGDWIQSMKQAHPLFLEHSRALFFFSGHGINSGELQLLLPADWLKPPHFNVNEALTAQNVMGGLWSVALPEEFLFVDACRSRPADLASMRLTGWPVLSEMPQTSVDPSRVSPLMWASAAGTETWQPDSPAGGLSLFGTALLEGLGSVPGNPECVHESGHISLYELGQFVNRRVSQLLKKHGSTVPRPIRIGESSDVCITSPVAPAPPPAAPAPVAASVPPAAAVPADDGAAEAGPATLGGRRRSRRRAEPAQTAKVGAAEGAAAPALEDLVEDDPAEWLSLPAEGIRPNEAPSHADLHPFFGSEHVSELFHGARALPLGGGDAGPSPIVVHAVRKGEKVWRVVFSVDADGPHWLQMRDWAHSYAAALPGDVFLRPRYTLDLAEDADVTFRRVEAGLSPDGPGVLGEMGRLWEKYSDLRLREVIGELDAKVFESALQSKMQSPLAAEIAGLFLLRGREYERLHDWLRNLAAWHPQRTDGPVLWAEHLRQAFGGKNRREGSVMLGSSGRAVPADQVEQLLEVGRRGLPFTAEALGYLSGQLEEVLRFAFFQRVRHTEEQLQQLMGLMRLRERVHKAMAHFRSGGLFAVYGGPHDSLSPGLVGPAS